MKINEFINGINFQHISDIIIDEEYFIFPEENSLKDGDIIWCKTDFILHLFNKIKNYRNKYLLITHCSDYSITSEIYAKKPDCIKKWFAQNVDHQAEDLIPLPIGVENHKGKGKGTYTNFSYLEENIVGEYTLQENRNKEKVYCNFSIGTNPNRKLIVSSLDDGYKFISGRLSYPDYCKSMSDYLFVMSPPGNGLDCHRTWEALYLGCVPIVQKHFMYDFYKDLPIIQTRNWNEINNVFLRNEFDLYRSKFTTYNFKKLNITYWFDLILGQK